MCISIHHEPGEDKYGYEKPEERWLPIHTVETIMISVISMLADPNGDSPANVDAAVRPCTALPCPVSSYVCMRVCIDTSFIPLNLFKNKVDITKLSQQVLVPASFKIEDTTLT